MKTKTVIATLVALTITAASPEVRANAVARSLVDKLSMMIDDVANLGISWLVVGAVLVLWLNQNGFTYPGMEEMAVKFNLPARIYPELSTIGLLLGPLIVLLACVVAALYPALRLRWMEPVQAMRAA